MNTKVVGTLVSMAFLSVVVYIAALLHVEPLHAAEILVFNEVAIEDGSLRPITKVDVYAPSVAPKANINATLNANVNSQVATTTANTTAQATVSSTTDLDIYTRDITEKDENVSNVVVKDDSVSVSYKEPAKIFGLIPTEVLVTVEVDDEGTVQVKYPWYAFLSGKNTGQLKPGLQAHVGQILKTATTTNSTATSTEKLSPQARAQIIQAIHTALKDLRANATTTVSY
jgi:hypothetical protein